MKILTTAIALLLFLLAACDAPQRNRFVDTTNASGVVDANGINTTGNGNFTNPPTDPGTNTGTGNPSTEPGYETCNLATTNYGGSLGYFGICKHQDDERRFKFLFQSKFSCQGGSNMSTNCGTCFVPMHLETTGSSFAVGTAECIHQNANSAYYGTFTKNRGETITAIMVIHRYHLDAFLGCMSAKSQFLSQCPGGAYNQSCIQQADQYAYTVCSSFTQQHTGHYKQVSLLP